MRSDYDIMCDNRKLLDKLTTLSSMINKDQSNISLRLEIISNLKALVVIKMEEISNLSSPVNFEMYFESASPEIKNAGMKARQEHIIESSENIKQYKKLITDHECLITMYSQAGMIKPRAIN